ncbi:TonB-linked SusC/RagA family outer membrane protein [Algoriphagus sp. 4150]|uniref:SusC/RagA family TonB-linked outer membrane protein n=1 Tax=Algoriphagus sp. 4150 TaxID=2817756 RepID=UPI00285DBD70|nr:TonB-dependent receptor [Algoriphagus sp. 4150]MDR7129039.1 TonB-linked SusC/RagA family outer membrane protein [Algoriphagus sp. 4150]
MIKKLFNSATKPFLRVLHKEYYYRLIIGLIFLVAMQSIAHAQNRTVSGTVTTDEDSEPLPGVSVLIKGTTRGVTTDLDGRYEIQVPEEGVTLVYSFIGFVSQEVVVNNLSQINVELKYDMQDLGEVVVVGYGTVKKSDLTGSVVSVRDKDLTAIPVTNALEVMQGKVPGLDLTKASGQAGAGLNIRLRGNRSLNAGNNPLVLVDGIIYGSTLDVNPNDIASIEVLKDAASTAIYGTLGANGVILITTKRGAKGKPKVSINSYYSTQSLDNYDYIMTGPEWVDFRRESRRTVGEWNSPEDDGSIFVPQQLENFRNGIYTDWANEVIGTGSQQNHQVSVAGADEKVSYYFSMEYFDEQSLFENDELKRYSGRMAVDYNASDKLKLSTNIMYTVRDQDRRRDPLNWANKISPLGPAYDGAGEIITLPLGDGTTVNPLNDQIPGNFMDNEINRRFFGNVSLEWKPVTSVNFTSRLGLDNSNSRRGVFLGENTIDVGPDGRTVGRATNNMASRVTWENFATYSKASTDHDFQVLLGQSMWATRNEEYFAEGLDLLSPTMLFHNLGASQDGIRINSSLVETSLASFFTRVNYKFKNKYIFNGVLRADGSSVLAAGNKWGFFPSAAVSWLAKEEGFLVDNSTISELKFRLSYGISGNSAVSPYQTLGGLSKSTYAWDQGTSEVAAFGYYPSLIAASLGWEETASLNFGIDFGFFNNRLTGSVDIYEQNTTDLLIERAVPATSGFTTAWDNVGKTRNRGIELLLSTINLDQPSGFKWSTDFTFTHNKEEILQLVEGDRDLANGWFVGYPISSHFDYEKIGIWQLGEEDQARANQQEVGEIKVKDQNGDGIITPDDRTILGSNVPRFNLGINNRVSYKGFDLSVFVFARQGNMIVSEANGSYKIDARENGPRVDYWTPENPTNAYPRPNAGTSTGNARYFSTLRYADGSFVKIRDITLGYNLPQQLIDHLSISGIRVYATAKNYFVWSNLGGYDPERGGNLSFPMTRQLLFGVNIEL